MLAGGGTDEMIVESEESMFPVRGLWMTLYNCAVFTDCDSCERPPVDRLQLAHYVKHGLVQSSNGFRSCGSDVGAKWRTFGPEWYEVVNNYLDHRPQ
jgi:hypothetical protein